MRRQASVVAVLLVSIVSGLAAGAAAQGTQTGALRGTVLDEQGLPIPGVTVTITSPQMQGSRAGVTADDGTFVFRQLPAGTYGVLYERAAFGASSQAADVPLGGEFEGTVTMHAAGISEEVQVVGEAPAPLSAPAVGLNVRNGDIDALATSRTLQGIATLAPGLTENSPNAGQVVINGAFAFDNIFMVNGVDVNDNLFGSPQGLFIEEAIQETQVLTSGIGAEYGRFSGGVVNAITRSGGNSFRGSYRLNLTNPAWAGETPFEEAQGTQHDSNLSLTHESTMGGPLVRDRLWFFGAGRLANTTTAEALQLTGVPYSLGDLNRRGEIKLTGTLRPNHTLQGGFLDNSRLQTNRPTFPEFSIDASVIQDRRTPNWYGFTTYRGVVKNNVLAEAQWSHRDFSITGAGGVDPEIVNSPFLTLTQRFGHYNAPYFDVGDPEQRNNRQVTGSLTSFLQGAGRHELKGGYEFFRSQKTGGSSQSATDYVFSADYAVDGTGAPVFDAEGRLVPVFVPGATMIQNWLPVRGAVLNVDTQSVYLQDHWIVNRHWTADAGVRYERVRSEATGGIVGVDTDTLVPRLAAAFDPRGDGRVVFKTTYGHYSGRYNEAQIAANSNVGEPDLLLGRYTGPAGQGRSFAPGFDPANYSTIYGSFPTVNVFFAPGLSSPITREFTFSTGAALGRRAHGEASYVWRDTSNFIEDFSELANGATTVVRQGFDVGTFTNRIFRNTNLARRNYQGAVLQGRYQATTGWRLEGHWTVQLQNDGNYEGEAMNQPGVPGPIGNYPEVFTEARHYPTGRLANFQRHRARVWSIYDFGMGRFGGMSLSGLLRAESGRVYDLVAKGLPLSDVQVGLLQGLGYADQPSDQNVYFGRGTETLPGYAVLDASVNYNIPLWGEMRPWLKLDLFNLLNNRTLIGFDTTVLPDPDGPVDDLGLPTRYIKGPSFGQATGNSDFPRVLGAGGGAAFRMAFGLRF